MSWNVNGVGPLLQKRISFDETKALYPLRAFLQRHAWPDFLCLQEVKINQKDSATRRRLQQAANEGGEPDEPEYNIVFSLPRDKYNATGFGGKVHGVASLIRHDTLLQVEATRTPDWDLEGRILIHELSNRLVIINGYWVNGTGNAYRDPATGKPDGDRHALKLRYHQHILDEVLGYERKGHQVILVGDMNIARQSIDGYPNLRTSPDQHVRNRYDFNQKFFHDDAGMKGVDVFRHLHKDQKKYTYWPRNRPWGSSMDRVDLIISSRILVEQPDAVSEADICDNEIDRGHSDHVPLWIVVNSEKTSRLPETELKKPVTTTPNDT